MQQFNTYQEALSFLYSQLPMYQRVGGKAMKPGLDNIKALLEAMGNPQDRLRCVHLAGTNGKGSTSHMLAAIFQAKGWKVGLYTSPHYKDFRERVKINGLLIEQGAVVDFLNNYRSAIEKVQPSYFELTVALAFDYFAKQEVDIAVIETGLGGLLDSTNVIQPILSVITNISYDHQDILGDTLAEIAFQKAGIIKKGIPVVIGETHPETVAVFKEVAAAKDAKISFADQELSAKLMRIEQAQMLVQIHAKDTLWFRNLVLDAAGSYQLKNLATCLAAIRLVQRELGISDEIILNGLSQMRQLTYFIGRWQTLKTQPMVVTDSAHNESGIQYAMEQLAAYDYDDLHMVIGFAADKDHVKMLSFFPKAAQYYFVKPKVPRGLPEERLAKIAEQAGLKGKAFPSIEAGMKAALQEAKPKDFIYIGGSSFVVAEAIAVAL